MAEKKERVKPLNLEDFLTQIKKQFGEKTVVNAIDVEGYKDVIPCTPQSLKNALGIGGYAKGKLYLIDGETSGGKSTLVYDAIGNEQKLNNTKCLLIDKEDSYTTDYGALMGIDNSNLIVIKPHTLEDMYMTITLALESKAFGLIGVDSVTMFAPQARFEGSDQMGIEARVNSDKARIMMDALEESNTALLMIQQTRQKIGGFGDPTTVSGGTALPFAAHVRIRITRSVIDRENQQNVMKFTVIKNKFYKPFCVGTVVYKWGIGFDASSEYAELSIEFGIIKKDGKEFLPPETDGLRVKTKKKMMEYLKDNPEYTHNVIAPLVIKYLEDNPDLRPEDKNDIN